MIALLARALSVALCVTAVCGGVANVLPLRALVDAQFSLRGAGNAAPVVIGSLLDVPYGSWDKGAARTISLPLNESVLQQLTVRCRRECLLVNRSPPSPLTDSPCASLHPPPSPLRSRLCIS